VHRFIKLTKKILKHIPPFSRDVLFLLIIPIGACVYYFKWRLTLLTAIVAGTALYFFGVQLLLIIAGSIGITYLLSLAFVIFSFFGGSVKGITT